MHRSAGCFILLLLGGFFFAALLLLPVFLLPFPAQQPDRAATATQETALSPTAQPEPVSGYRAIWISYLEWQQVDFTSADAFRADVAGMMKNCAELGANVVIAHVRPFGDALYDSELFPYSHLCTGTQGLAPGFDPLEILLAEAGRLGLEVEAWINPYRLQDGGTPESLAENSLARLYPDWVCKTDSGLWLNPALTCVQDYIAEGIRELCAAYPVHGIHFDDYFYPTTDTSFDHNEYTVYLENGGNLPLDDWRRENVSTLVQKCCAAAHEYGVRFGIAPQGNLDNNYNGQYSDVARWLREPGYVDYLMPQLYWGAQYENGGDTALSLPELAAAWLALPRSQNVQLYAGLGAYRIGAGDGSTAAGEWVSGHALASQIQMLHTLGIRGAALYRYDSLFANTSYPELAAQERDALHGLWYPGEG